MRDYKKKVLVFLLASILLISLFSVSVESVNIGEFKSMLVLGSHKEKVLQNRVNGAYQLIHNGNFQKIVLSGGCGAHGTDKNNCEAEKMAQLLLEKGVNQTKIMLENKATSTSSNYKNSKKHFSQGEKTVIVSDHHHVKAVAYCLRYQDGVDAYYYQIGTTSQPEMPSINLVKKGGDYGGLAKSCKVNHANLAQSQPTQSTSSSTSGTQPSGYTVPQQPSYSQSQSTMTSQVTTTAKQVDEVWTKIGGYVRGSDQVWHNGNWMNFIAAYPPPVVQQPIQQQLQPSGGFGSSNTQGSGAMVQPGSQVGAVVFTKSFSSSEWESYQKNLASTQTVAGKAGGDPFTGFITEIVTVDKPDFNGQSPGKLTINLNPSQSCPSDVCLNDITLKAKRAVKKTGVMIHATVGNDYLGLTKGWNQQYWDPMPCHEKSVKGWNSKYSDECGTWPVSTIDENGNENQKISDSEQDKMAECAKKINPKAKNSGYRKSVKNCMGVWGHTHYIFGRDGNYAQHASEYANIWHSSTGSGDTQIPQSQWDVNTVAIETANAMYNCNGICHSDSRTYKGKTAVECGQDDCVLPSTLWGDENNYRPKGDRNYKKKLNKIHEKYDDRQIKGLIKLVAEIMIRHEMDIDNLVRHSDNSWRDSGSTHTDPGVAFDWMGFKKAVCQAIAGYNGQPTDCNNLNVCDNC